jgi:hypothetical protein
LRFLSVRSLGEVKVENMDYKLVDLIDIEEFKKLTDNWTKLINLPMGIFDPHGNYKNFNH